LATSECAKAGGAPAGVSIGDNLGAAAIGACAGKGSFAIEAELINPRGQLFS